MIKALTVKNYVLIDSLDIEFPAGLIIITGQTGAGKSIILGALSLALGAKADASMVGEGGDSCVVEVEFDSANDETLKALIESNELDWNEGKLLIRRVLARSGRSRCFVNDEPVSVSVLNSLSSHLVDIHSQHETLLLRDKAFQLSMLDHYAGASELLGSVRGAYAKVCDLKSALADAEGQLKKLSAEKDYYQAQFDRLDKAALVDGELEELEAEQRQLANAEEIKGDLFAVGQLFSPEGDALSVDGALKETVKLLGRVSKFIPKAEGLAQRVESLRLELDDIQSDISDMEASVDVSPQRLAVVEDRMSLLYDLMKKHSCGTVAELIALRDELSEKLYDSTALEAQRSRLVAELGAANAELTAHCAELHKVRCGASESFAKAIEESIRSLELERAVFKVEISQTAVSSTGADEVKFLFSSTGSNPVDVARCASGGEMSRIMLCLKAMMARYVGMPSMIFDEIDTGVSGSAADKMGTMICQMGRFMQVYAITHLPQVAAKGDAHYVVSKQESKDGKVHTTIRRIEGEERVMEIARMLSGSTITLAAVANAESLLK